MLDGLIWARFALNIPCIVIPSFDRCFFNFTSGRTRFPMSLRPNQAYFVLKVTVKKKKKTMEENDKTTDFTKPTGVPFFPNPRRTNWTKAIVERGILKDRSMVSVDIQRAAEDKLVEKARYDETVCCKLFRA